MQTIRRRVISGVSLQRLHEALIMFFLQSLYKYYLTERQNTRKFLFIVDFQTIELYSIKKVPCTKNFRPILLHGHGLF